MNGSRNNVNDQTNRAVIEAMEARRLYSADLAGFFAGTSPTTLNAAHAQHVSVGVVNEGDATAAGQVTVLLYARSGSDDIPGTLLARKTKNVKVESGGAAIFNLAVASHPALANGNYSLGATCPGVKGILAIVNRVAVMTRPPRDFHRRKN